MKVLTFRRNGNVAELAASRIVVVYLRVWALRVEVRAVPLDGHCCKYVIAHLAGELVADIVCALPIASDLMQYAVIYAVSLDAPPTAAVTEPITCTIISIIKHWIYLKDEKMFQS